MRPPLWVLGALLGLAACSADEPGPPPPDSATASAQDEVLLSPACVDGAVEPCTLVLGEHGGIVSCYEGVRSCAGGSFGACSDGHAFEVERGDPALAGAPGLRPLAFSAAVDCTDNPCNRYCREFEEAPSRGLLADVVTGVPPMSSWLTGNASDYPPEWQVLGNREPCQMASDCQLNTSCSDPSPGSCEHSVCSEGAALQDGCSRCADAVCEKNPFCCGPQLACAHDPCEVGTGAPLNPRCDTCVNAVCEAHPECCDDVWNEACVSYVATECAPLGQSCGCPAGGVDGGASCVLVGEETNYDWFAANAGCQEKYGFGLITIDDERENEAARLAVEGAGLEGAWLGGLEVGVGVWNWMSVGEQFFDGASGTLVPPYTYANWDSGEPTLGAAGNGVMLAPDGLWRSFPIDKPLGYLCEGPKNVLTPRQLPTLAWDSECAALAPELCGVSCSDGLGSGTCTAHVPTDLDASCAGYDLSLGATCEEAGTSQIPVCNHGQTAAPAGLRLVHLPIEQFRRAEPDLSEAVDCTLTESIPAGRCVALSDCPGLSADRALLVNPPGATQDTFECRRDDNWSIYRPLPCGAAVCESGVHDAGRVRNTGCAIDLEHPLGVDTATARVTVGSEVPVPTCGPGEQRFGASCYLFETEPATWDDARARCRSRGDSWDLVALNSPAESDWVRSQTDPDDAVQIGLTDRAAEGSYVWSNGSCRAFDNWDTSTGQPDNAPAGSENCARMSALSGGLWEDASCSDGVHTYVCEGPQIDARGGCAAGQLAGPDGNCYRFTAAGVDYGQAKQSCADISPGWQLALIEGEKTNAFATSLIGCTPTWLGSSTGYSNWAPAEVIDTSLAPYMDELGVWHTSDPGASRAVLCQGPATATAAPVLSPVANEAACTGDDQFYFTGNDTAPEQLHLCPLACDAAAALDGRLLEVEIGCAPPAQPARVTEHRVLYGDESRPAPCPGSTPQWDFLYYDAVTPADSRIELLVRSAGSEEQLATGGPTPILVASAHALPTDTQRCDGVGEGCPVDLYGALGDADQLQQNTVLELLVRMVPGSNGEGPMLRDWTVRFSCPPSQ